MSAAVTGILLAGPSFQRLQDGGPAGHWGPLDGSSDGVLGDVELPFGSGQRDPR